MNMTGSALETINYETRDRQVAWRGISLNECEEFDTFMAGDVSSRLQDEEGTNDFKTTLRSLATTGFAQNSLNEILAAESIEERDWAVGEAIAEAYLTRRHNVNWPWNMERDERTPKASLPGADLVGFEIDGYDIRLALGEVKTSGEAAAPPGVMNGRGGMKHQIDDLATDLRLVAQLLKWLLPRCKGSEHQSYFNVAVSRFLNSGNKAVALFGVLIRDTKPNQLDLEARGHALAGTVSTPATCQLVALYLPLTIADLPKRVLGGKSP
jgi:hypothetical protein